MYKHLGRHLTRFLSSTDRPEGTLGYYELQGFLFAIACAPELIRPSEWLPLVFNDQDAVYADMEEARSILQSLMDLYNLINTQIFTADVHLPDDITIQKLALDNIGEAALLGQWSRGFFMGHNWLIELWDHYIPDALDKELVSSLIVLSFFSNRQLAEAYYKEIAETSGKALNEFAAGMLAMFEDAMNSYAHMGRSIQTALAEQNQPQQPYVKEEKAGRNDPCHCGSGKKYKKCCGAHKRM